MKLGLALSGGGIRGIAHAGALKALEENNIKIDVIGGTSSGSIIATLYAMGYSPYYIYILFKRYARELVNQNPKSIFTSFGNFFSNKKVPFAGFYSGEEIERGFDEVAKRKGIRKLTDINMPVVVPAVDLKDSKEYIFTNFIPENSKEKDKYITDISIGKAVRASCSYPGMFAPTIFKEHKFVDGGIIDNLPAQEVRKLGADKVLSIRFSSKSDVDPKNVIEVALKSVDLLFEQRTDSEVQSSDFAMTLDLSEASVFNIKKIDYCYNQGYIAAIENMKKIKDCLNK